MLFIIGFVVVTASVVGGCMGAGGHVAVLWQPLEFVIIFGVAISPFVIGNPKTVLSGTVKAFGLILKGSRYTKTSYLELLGVLYAVFRLAKLKSDLILRPTSKSPTRVPLSSVSQILQKPSRRRIPVRLYAFVDTGHQQSP